MWLLLSGLFFVFCFYHRTRTGKVKSFHAHSSKVPGMDFGGHLFL